MTFIPARNKLEAVARISSLTNSGPETLGPGSKERKSVVQNLAAALGVLSDPSESKHEIARRIAAHLEFEWDSRCESRGQTLTLFGLNLLLEHSTEMLNRPNQKALRFSQKEEISRISNVVIQNTPSSMDGRKCVEEMRRAEFSKWRQTEWQGFYFEFRVCPALINELGGGPRRVLNTTFDYALSIPWDLKVHSRTDAKARAQSKSQLNDKQAIIRAVRDGGFGLVILSGVPIYDAEFTIWHKRFRGRIETDFRRVLKKSFVSERLDFFHFKDIDCLERAMNSKMLSDFNQGRQQSGEPRKPKLMLDLEKAMNSEIHVGSYTF